MSEHNLLTIKGAHNGLIKKEFSAVELTQSCLEAIKKVDHQINGFITVNGDNALLAAKDIDAQIARGDELSPLAGIPYAAKDNFCTAGVKTTAASQMLADFVPVHESTTTARLNKLGAILLGKTNLDEFAMGSSTENSAFFTTKNPRDVTRVPGGSSGGSAAALAAGEALFSLGTDTGGSIRQPAALCGVVGLKPTYGRTSRYGVISMASSLDTIGHFARTVEDAAIVLQAIAGADDFDATTSRLAPDNYLKSLKKDIKGLRVGLPKKYFAATGFDPAVKELVMTAIKKIESLTHEPVREISLPATDYALAAYYIIMPAEVSSNLARFDGQKYGLSVPNADLLASYLSSRGQGFGAEVKRRIILGTYTLSHGYYDAYYKKALAVRAMIKKDFENAFREVDVLVAPTTPTTAFKLGEKIADPMRMYLSDIFTIPVSLAGLPALSLPCGLVNNLPVGLQIIGRQFDEKTILRVGHWYEKTTSITNKK